MSIITLPEDLLVGVGSGMGQQRYDLVGTSDSTGSQQVRLLAPPRWTMSLIQPAWLSPAEAGRWQSLVARLRGRANVLAAWDVARPAPRGTARGSMSLASTAAAGATALTISGAAPGNNLLFAGSALTAAAWSFVSAAPTANTHVAPDGTTTADTVQDNSALGGGYARQAVSVPDDSQLYKASCYVRKTTGATAPTFCLALEFQGGGTSRSAYVRFNTDTGAVIFGTGTVVDAGAYWLFETTLSNNATGHTTLRYYVFPAWAAYGATTQDLTITGGAVVWGCKLQPAAGATDYTPPTLLAGDWLQIGTGVGSHYCMVTADATENDAGQLVVSIEPPTRASIASATVVTWDKPLVYLRQQQAASSWQYTKTGGVTAGFALDLLETWQE